MRNWRLPGRIQAKQIYYRPYTHIKTDNEKCYEYKIELNKLFVDFSQAFDKAHRSKTIEILKLIKIPNKLTRLVKMTVQNTRAVVETEHGRSEKFNINTGLRQGDALSTLLF